MKAELDSGAVPDSSTINTRGIMSKEEFDKIRDAHVKLYGKRWKEYFVKHYWRVYDGAEIGSTGSV